MRYILNPYIALRSWMLVPYAYYIKGERNAKGLTAEEFAFLTECDGRSELPDEAESPLARKFLADGFIRRAESSDVLSDWSRPRLCPNRYFPAMNWMITGIRCGSIRTRGCCPARGTAATAGCSTRSLSTGCRTSSA